MRILLVNNIFYGIRRLVLINTESYSLGDFPLDKPLSISGSNNLGKSTAINALQFPFLCNMKDMSFPKNNDSTRRYYFPHENSYVLVEVVTESGTYVIGASGKGQASGFEYQLFAYKSSLNLDDFVAGSDDSGQQIRNFKDLSKNLAINNIWIKPLTATQMRGALMGQMVTLPNKEKFTIGIFRLENMTESSYKLFIKVFKNLLHMNQASLEDIKKLLIKILLPYSVESSTDLMVRYKISYEEVDKEEHKVRVATDITDDVQKLVSTKEAYDEHCGILRALYPKIISSYEETRDYRVGEISRMDNKIKEIDPKIKEMQDEYKPLKKQNEQLIIDENKIKERLDKINEDDSKFMLYPPIDDFEIQIESKKVEYESLVGEIESTRPEDIGNINASLKDISERISIVNARLSAIDNNILFLLSSKFSEPQLNLITKLINSELLTSIPLNGKDAIVKNEKKLISWLTTLLSSCEGGFYDDGQIQINLSSINSINLVEYFDFEKTKELQKRLKEDKGELNRKLKIASEYDAMKKRKHELEANLKDDNSNIMLYRLYLNEKEQQNVIIKDYSIAQDLTEKSNNNLEQITEKLDGLRQKKTLLISEKQKKDEALFHLEKNFKNIRPLSKDDGDGSIPPESLPTSLENMVETYLVRYEEFKKTDGLIQLSFSIIENKGGLIFFKRNDMNSSIRELSEAIKEISSFKTAVENKQRAAGQEIGQLLKTLRDRYNDFNYQIKEFNSRMNRLKISNIKTIKFITDDDNEIMEVINELVEHESLFSSPEAVHIAVKRLDELVTENGVNLALENIFNLGVTVSLKSGKVVTSYQDLNVESQGTGFTINIIINLMLLKELMSTKRGQTINIPIYIDEAGDIDPDNQDSIIKQCADSGFVPIMASVKGQPSADYWIGLEEIQGRIFTDQKKWYKLDKNPIDNEELIDA